MKSFYHPKTKMQAGFTLIEVLVASAIISVTIFAIMSAASKGIILSSSSLKMTQANFLLEEGAEAVKIIRDNDFETIGLLPVETPLALCFDQSLITWKFADASCPVIETIDSFTRQIVITNVLRDASGDIVASGGDEDPKSKKVAVTVSWQEGNVNKSRNLQFYLFDIFN